MSPQSTALLVVGNEEFLRARIINDFITTLAADQPLTGGDLSSGTADGDTLTLADVHELLAPNLFGGYPILHITNGHKLTKDVLAHIVAAVADPGCAVIVEIVKSTDAGAKAVTTALAKAGATHTTVTPPKNAGDRKQFATTELRRVGLRAHPRRHQCPRRRRTGPTRHLHPRRPTRRRPRCW